MNPSYNPEQSKNVPLEKRINELIKALNDESIQESVIRALVEIGEPVLPYIHPLTKSSEPEEQLLAVKILCKMNPPDTTQLLRILKETKNLNLKGAIIRCFGAIGSKAKQAIPALMKNLADSNIWVHAAAAKALKKIRGY